MSPDACPLCFERGHETREGNGIRMWLCPHIPRDRAYCLRATKQEVVPQQPESTVLIIVLDDR